MRWKAPRPPLEEAAVGDGPADTATVVVGIDGLAESWDAFCWACDEARRLGGRAVGVFTSPTARTGQLVAAMLREAGDLDLTFVDAAGEPVAQLLRVAREVHADLLVVGGPTGHRMTGAVGRRFAGRRRRSVIVIFPASRDALTAESSGR
jgi:nucleotide-binding universal stress UspA family protein